MNRQPFFVLSLLIAAVAFAKPEQPKPQPPPEALTQRDPDAPVIPKYCVPTKPATMESEAFRRAKRNHRGLPIDGCAPVPRHLMRERFGEPDPRPSQKANESPTKKARPASEKDAKRAEKKAK